jgi:hypothetical protein
MPILISVKNAEAVVGQSWRWVKQYARDCGVPIYRANGKPFIEAEAFAPGGDGLPAAGGGGGRGRPAAAGG